MTKKTFIITYLIIALLIIVDQITKMVVLTNLKYEGSAIPVISNFFAIELVFNTGAAWGIGSSNTIILTVISFICGFIALFFTTKNNFKTKKFYSIALCLIIAGAFGNLIDRFLTVLNVLDGVIDFLSFRFGNYNFPVFNVADMCLVIGVIMLVIDVIFLEDIRKKKNNA